MAFWSSGSQAQPRRNQQPGAAKPVTAIFHCTADLSTLVRLRLKAADAARPAAAAAGGDLDDDDAAEEAAAAHAAAAMSSLHKIIMDIESKSADARTSCIIEVLTPGTLQLLCQKAVAAKLFKALISHQKALGFALGDVRSCISVTPLGLWELNAALQTAVIKALTGTSTGCSSSSSSSSSDGSWMCLSRSRLVATNLLQAAPGLLATAPFVELEAVGESPHKLLLTVKAAGSVRFRPFSPMQALAAEPKCLRAPLQPADTDQQLLQDPAKLAAAARQLDGRAVKLLPDEGVAFIKSLRPRPSNPEQLQQLETRWRGQYGLQLPDDWLFLVGVAASEEAEGAFAEVPSCCVLTSLGLSVLPGSAPGGAAFSATLVQVAAVLQGSELQLWGRLSAERDGTPAGTSAAAAAAVQVTQPSQHGADAAGGAAAQQPKQYNFSSSWTSAKDISELQAAAKPAAAKAPPQKQQQQQQPGSSLSAAAAQLMGLQEADAAVQSAAAAAAAPSDAAAAAAERRQQRGSSSSSSSEFKELKAFLAARKAEQQEAAGAGSSSASGHAVRPTAGAGPSGPKPPAAALHQPQFGSRRVFGAAPAAALRPAAKQIKMLPAKPPGLPAAAGAGPSAAAGPPAAPAAVGGPPKAPALLKRPPAAGAPKPAAKKAKAAMASNAAGGAAAAAAAKPRKQAKAKAPPAPAAEAPAAGSAAAGEPAAAPAAAAVAGEAARKRTKASDLDSVAVAARVAAAYAAGGGSSLKGVSVPEMQCYLRGQGIKGGSAKRADVEARLLGLLAGGGAAAKA